MKFEIKEMKIVFEKLENLMDNETYKWHHDIHYAGYVNKRNEIEKELENADKSKANANYSLFRELKLEETWNGNGALLHELYWNSLGGNGAFDENLEIIKKINDDFGSMENWKQDFIACGKSARGWAVLSLDLFSDKNLRNFLYDVHNQGGVVGSIPLIALDVFEHAYYHKFGPDRAAYIAEFINNIDWKKVNETFVRYSKH
ncbi:MAG: superoxide dismutase [Candidatus Marsarchaeota archaeon]|nr:superoxide dismutase [Candidatus Marsarchaeota archaeon]MCL5095009.1 superoxide dismutase [Candidatus Marsarchaeota archaeon]